jgi:DNA-binding MarR family transcriptional regulator
MRSSKIEEAMTETAQNPRYQDIALPALLRWGQQTYGGGMRRALAEAGCDDIPPNGMFVIGALALGTGNGPVLGLQKALAISKQAVGQLIDTLVLRGYLKREADAEDRRRISLKLTERGWHAAAAQREMREKIDGELAARVGADGVAALRRALGALVEIGGEQGGGD